MAKKTKSMETQEAPKLAGEAVKQIVVINPNPRAVVLPGVEPIRPGRNLRDKTMVEAAMKNPRARMLGLIIELPGDPEKEDEATRISHVVHTYDPDALAAQLDTEPSELVRAKIREQIEKIKPTKKPSEAAKGDDEDE